MEVLKREWKVSDVIQLTFKNTILHFDFTSFKPNFLFRAGRTALQASLFAQAVCARRRLVCTRRPAFDSHGGVCDSWQAQGGTARAKSLQGPRLREWRRGRKLWLRAGKAKAFAASVAAMPLRTGDNGAGSHGLGAYCPLVVPSRRFAGYAWI